MKRDYSWIIIREVCENWGIKGLLLIIDAKTQNENESGVSLSLILNTNIWAYENHKIQDAVIFLLKVVIGEHWSDVWLMFGGLSQQ